MRSRVRSDDNPGERRRQRRVTCPNSAHLETIVYVADSEGYIAHIEACSAFEPGAAVDCNQLCRQRLNSRRRLERGEPDADDDVTER